MVISVMKINKKYKNMKTRLNKCVSVALLSLAMVILTLSFTSCEEYGIDSQSVSEPKLGTTAQPAYVVSSTSPREIKFTVTSNTPWTIVSDQSWCAPTPTSSTVSALIMDVAVSIEDNAKLSSRSATLTISGEGIERQEITITQSSKGILEVAMFETGVRFNKEGEDRKFTINSTKDWTIVSNKSWLTFNVSSGEGMNKVIDVTATVEKNNALIRRANVIITNGLEEKTYEVVQDGIQLEIIDIDDSMLNYAGGSKTYKLQANIEWQAEIVPGSEWINIVTASGTGSADLVVEVTTANPIFIPRKGQVLVKPKNPVAGLEDVIIDVTQDVGSTVQSGTINFTEEGAGVIEEADSRFVTKEAYGMGEFTWKFKSIDVSAENAYFEINGWASAPAAKWMLTLYSEASTKQSNFCASGSWGWSADAVFNPMPVTNDTKTLTVKILPDPNDADKVICSVIVNGVLVHEYLKDNVFADPATKVNYYYGLKGGDAGSIIIESFTANPIQ